MHNYTFKDIIGKDENILWQGKPNKACFILEGFFNSFLPFAIIWAVFDAFFIYAASTGNMSMSVNGQYVNPNSQEAQNTLIFFFAIHLMPVWIYILGALSTFFKYKNTFYLITDKNIYISNGILSHNFNIKPYSELNYIQTNRGFFDQLLGVGDVILARERHRTSKGGTRYVNYEICDIPDYIHVFRLVKEKKEEIAPVQETKDSNPQQEINSISDLIDIFKPRNQ